MSLLALHWVDLGAFVALGLATLVITTHVVGMALWLRRRAKAGRDDGYYAGL